MFKPNLLLAVGLAFGCSPKPTESPASVLLISIDTLRADRLGVYGDTRARTPSIDALGRSGVVFDRAYTPVPITLPAHASIMTGLLPPAHGVRGNGAFSLGPDLPTLAEVMKSSGRKTAAFIGGFPLTRRFGLARGFDLYDDAMSKAPGVNYDFAERRAADVVSAAVTWLRATPGPTFLWVHLFDPHAPYDPPEAFRTDDPYRDEIASVDAAVRDLIVAWDARPGSSAVALLSDHGEAFGEHGEWSHGLFVYDTTLHVPLILRGPGFKAGTRVKENVSLIEVGATLIEASGIGTTRFPGTSLTRVIENGAPGEPLYAETLAPRLDFGWSELRSWREGGAKWIRAPRPELYAINDDPGEQENRAAVDPAEARRLDGDLSRALAGMGDRSETRATDSETEERLRSLGYVQGPGGRGSGADPKDKIEVARRIAASNGGFKSWGEVIETYQSLLGLDPPNPLLNMRLADALLRSGRPEAALQPFSRVVKAGPRSADPYVGYAAALAQLGRMKEARRILEQGLAVDPRSGQIHYNLGEIARVEGRLEDARREYEAARGDPITASRAEARLAALP